jgi:hypothetical protein
MLYNVQNMSDKNPASIALLAVPLPNAQGLPFLPSMPDGNAFGPRNGPTSDSAGRSVDFDIRTPYTAGSSKGPVSDSAAHDKKYDIPLRVPDEPDSQYLKPPPTPLGTNPVHSKDGKWHT